MKVAEKYQNLQKLIDELLVFWGNHKKYIETRFQNATKEDLQIADDIASKIIVLAEGDLLPYLEGYKWTCDAVVQEEFYFARNGFNYRYSTFKEAYENVYSKPEIMIPYIKGILMTQVFWSNHTKTHRYFKELLSKQQGINSYLEIGPGHGLFLANASNILPSDVKMHAWDVSKSSLEETKKCLAKFNIKREIELKEQDVNTAKTDKKFDIIVLSEVLEHIQDPLQILKSLNSLLSENGKLFLNVPINSPCPDHIFNWETPQDFYDMIEKAGLQREETNLIEMTGGNIEDAIKNKKTISIITTCKRFGLRGELR